MEKPLEGIRVAILATDMFEEAELKKPQEALEEAGAITEIISPKEPEIMAARHFDKAGTYAVDRLLSEADPADYDALLLPGGALNADALRMEPQAQKFARYFDATNKPIAVICHGAWLLASTDLVRGRTMTSYYTIADDLRNAGAKWVDEAVVRDGNWVSSRQPDDLPVFNAAMINLFSELTIDNPSFRSENLRETMAEPAFREQLGLDEEE